MVPPALKHPRRLPALAAVLVLAVAAGASRADTLRCGSDLIRVGDTRYEVLDRCGDPDSRALVGYRTWRAPEPTGPLGYPYPVETQVPLERWVYDRGYGQFLGILHFEGGRLRAIELGPRR